MAYSKGITKRSYGGDKSSNPNKPESKGQNVDRMPSIADHDPAGNKITTNYPVKDSANRESRTRGGEVEVQNLRGFVHNEKKFGVRNVQNGNDRRGRPPTIHSIEGP